MEKLAVCSGKDIDKVQFFISLEQLQKYCSERYAKKIRKAHENNCLHGLYLTTAGKIKATFM
jgi:hypothetical protein